MLRLVTFFPVTLLLALCSGCGSDPSTEASGADPAKRSFKVTTISPGKISLKLAYNAGDWIMIGRLDGVGNYGICGPGESTGVVIEYADGAVSADFGSQKIGPGKMSGLVLLADKSAMKASGGSILLGHRTVDGKDYEWGLRIIDAPDRQGQKTFK